MDYNKLIEKWETDENLTSEEMQETHRLMVLAMVAKNRCQCEIDLGDPTELSAICIHCKTDHGWKCSTSPDHVCHYFSTPHEPDPSLIEVELITGTVVIDPMDYNKNYDKRNEGLICIFCNEFVSL